VTTATEGSGKITATIHYNVAEDGALAYRASPALLWGTAMEMRIFGRTGLKLSVLGFGCGAVGGLMVRGDPVDQERTIARAIGAGVNYFDTAVQYGDGESEKNLGRILHQLRPPDAVVGTKVRLPSASFGNICRCRGDITRTQPDTTAA
jgi:aryl-alcohol dehydrogenase-like predicted oxidoreductase